MNESQRRKPGRDNMEGKDKWSEEERKRRKTWKLRERKTEEIKENARGKKR